MAGKFKNTRVHSIDPFKEGATISVDVSASKRILHAVYIVIAGKIDLTAAATAVAPGGVANLLRRLEFTVSGYDPAVKRKLNAETRINVRGRYFSYSGSTASNQDNGQARFNCMATQKPYIANGDMIEEIDHSSLLEQTFRMVYEVPFYLPGGYQPRDLHLDMANLDSAIFRLSLGNLKDIGRGAQDAAGEIKDATVTVIVEEMEFEELIEYRGGAELPKGYLSLSEKTINIEADNAAFRESVQLAANLLEIQFYCYGSSGEPIDSVFQSCRLEREGKSSFDLDRGMIRTLNYKYHPEISSVKDNQTYPFFLNSGLYLVEIARDENGINLAQSRNVGNGNNQTNMILSLKKAPAGSATMEIVTKGVYLDEELSAVTKQYKDMTTAERVIADRAKATLNERASIVETDARRLGVGNS